MIIFLAVLSANATVLTVNNGTVSGGQYTSAQAAIDASAEGDTVYIHGSNTSYGNVTLKKRIVLLGAGHTPQSTQYNMKSELGYIYLNKGTSVTLPTGSVIKGIDFSYLLGNNGSLDVNNITIERCNSYAIQVLGNGWLIANSILPSLDINYFSNVIVNNNFITSISGSNKPSVLITNNIFISGGNSNSLQPDVSYVNITNNIFINPESSFGAYSSTFKQNTLSKNIFVYADPQKFIDLQFPNNSSSGNLNTANPQFVSDIPLLVSTTLLSSYDWHLLSTSVGKNYGTDGTDVGIYGGSYPMPNLTGAPNIPQMISVDIENSVIPQNGILNVAIKARSQK